MDGHAIVWNLATRQSVLKKQCVVTEMSGKQNHNREVSENDRTSIQGWVLICSFVFAAVSIELSGLLEG